jgi:hypothetical protein
MPIPSVRDDQLAAFEAATANGERMIAVAEANGVDLEQMLAVNRHLNGFLDEYVQLGLPLARRTELEAVIERHIDYLAATYKVLSRAAERMALA